jgi:hypothetical protein
MNIKSGLLIIFILLLTCRLIGQEDTTKGKFFFAVDLGYEVPNNTYASFLNGNHVFGADRVLSFPQNRQQIEQTLGYPILGWEYSQNLTYQPTIFTGVNLGYRINEEYSIIMKFDIAILRFATPFIIELNNPRNFTGEFEQVTISAREQRFWYSLGLEKKFDTEIPQLKPYVSGGASFNFIQLEQHELVIRNLRYNIMRVNTNQGLILQQVQGFGYGVFAEAGAAYKLNDKFTVSLGGNFNLQSNKDYVDKLIFNTNYNTALIEKANKFLLSFNAYFRLMWN